MTKPSKQKQRLNAPVDPNQQAMAGEPQEIVDASRAQDVQSTRAKSTRHGKMTADKANQ